MSTDRQTVRSGPLKLCFPTFERQNTTNDEPMQIRTSWVDVLTASFLGEPLPYTASAPQEGGGRSDPRLVDTLAFSVSHASGRREQGGTAALQRRRTSLASIATMATTATSATATNKRTRTGTGTGLGVALLRTILATTASASSSEVEFSYDPSSNIGPEYWKDLQVDNNQCGGLSNSPIALQTKPCTTFADYTFTVRKRSNECDIDVVGPSCAAVGVCSTTLVVLSFYLT
jgi:hypothetical protein